MNRVVRLEDLLVRQGVLAIVLFAAVLRGVLGQQQVPDAPTPQGPDSLGNITSGVTPGKGTRRLRRTRARTPPRYRPPPATAGRPGPGQQTPPEVPAPGELQKDLTTFVTTVNYVIVPVTVLDKKHQQVAGLTWRDFEIYENNVRQRIALFSADAGAALGCPGHRPEPAPGHHEEGER